MYSEQSLRSDVSEVDQSRPASIGLVHSRCEERAIVFAAGRDAGSILIASVQRRDANSLVNNVAEISDL